ncbi:MAG: hypothetical protein WED34_18615 [Planctomycetales bacterium]
MTLIYVDDLLASQIADSYKASCESYVEADARMFSAAVVDDDGLLLNEPLIVTEDELELMESWRESGFAKPLVDTKALAAKFTKA